MGQYSFDVSTVYDTFVTMTLKLSAARLVLGNFAKITGKKSCFFVAERQLMENFRYYPLITKKDQKVLVNILMSSYTD